MSAKRSYSAMLCKTCDCPLPVYYQRHNPAIFCSRACKYSYRLQRGFWEYLDKSGGPDSCWEWQGSRSYQGYGIISSRGKNFIVSRIVYAAVHGPIPTGLLVCHHCDNPPCGNPAHLFLGTTRDNSLDALHKGRLRGQYAPGTTHGRGERNGLSKLTENDVRTIRALGVTVKLSVLAKRFGVNTGTIHNVLTRTTWKHI